MSELPHPPSEPAPPARGPGGRAFRGRVSVAMAALQPETLEAMPVSLPVMNRRDEFYLMVNEAIGSGSPMLRAKQNRNRVQSAVADGSVPQSYIAQAIDSSVKVNPAEREATWSAEAAASSGSLAWFTELARLESEERTAVESLRDDIVDVLHAGYTSFIVSHTLSSVPKPATQATQAVFTDTQRLQMYQLFFHRMKSFIRSRVLDVFPRGTSTANSGLTPKEACELVTILTAIDTIIADREVDSIAYPAYPKLRVTLTNAMPKFRAVGAAWIAVKCALQSSERAIEDIKHSYIRHYHDRDVPPPLDLMFCFKLIDAAAMFTKVSAELYDRFVPDFYSFLQSQEDAEMERLKASDPAADSSFNSSSLPASPLGNVESTIRVDYQRGEEIGRGAFGVVYRCINVKTGRFLALKELRLPHREDQQRAVRSEVRTLQSLAHPNIVQCYGAFFDHDAQRVGILMEYAPKNLKDMSQHHGGLATSLVALYMRKILQGLAYLHSQNVIHRDIKAANVLVTESGDVKVSDFGTATVVTAEMIAEQERATLERVPTELLDDDAYEERMLDRQRNRDQRQALVGTPLFMAPEILSGCLPSEASDIWAAGCMLIELVSGSNPWWELTAGGAIPVHQLLYRIGNATEPPTFPPNVETEVPEVLTSFLAAMVKLSPHERASAAALLNHPFIVSAQQQADVLSRSSMESSLPTGEVRPRTNSTSFNTTDNDRTASSTVSGIVGARPGGDVATTASSTMGSTL